MFVVFASFYAFGLKVTKSAQIFFSQKAKIGIESAEVGKYMHKVSKKKGQKM
jgi:hypothetical protein